MHSITAFYSLIKQNVKLNQFRRCTSEYLRRTIWQFLSHCCKNGSFNSFWLYLIISWVCRFTFCYNGALFNSHWNISSIYIHKINKHWLETTENIFGIFKTSSFALTFLSSFSYRKQDFNVQIDKLKSVIWMDYAWIDQILLITGNSAAVRCKNSSLGCLFWFYWHFSWIVIDEIYLWGTLCRSDK